MANELQGQCWLIDFPTPPMRLVAMKLCDCAEPDGTSIYPSVATVAEETGLGQSTVRRAIAAFESCGLLAVKDHKFGNRAGRTTVVREMDTDLLRAITGQRRKGQSKIASSHVMREFKVEVAAGQRDVQVPGALAPSLVEAPARPEDDVARRVAVWAIVPRETSPTPPGAGGVPQPEREGHPSRSGSPPLPEREGTPPGAGANPFTDPSLDPSPPPPPKSGGRGRGEKRKVEVQGLVDQVIAAGCGDPQHRAVVDVLIEHIVRSLKIDAPDPLFALRRIVDWAAKHPIGLSATVRDRILATRKVSVKPADIEDELRRAIGEAKRDEALKSSPRLITGTAAFRAAIDEVARFDHVEAARLAQHASLDRGYVERTLASLRARVADNGRAA